MPNGMETWKIVFLVHFHKHFGGLLLPETGKACETHFQKQTQRHIIAIISDKWFNKMSPV
jgi:hypothetical protein